MAGPLRSQAATVVLDRQARGGSGSAFARFCTGESKGEGLMKSRSFFVVLLPICAVASALWAHPAKADVVAEYTTAGATVNTNLFDPPGGGFLIVTTNEITASATHLFVANALNDAVGEYNPNGTTVNAALITESGRPFQIGLSGGDIFVLNGNG